MIKRFNGVISSIAFLVFSIAMFIGSFNIDRLTITRIGADSAPKLVSILIFICSIFLLVSSILKVKSQKNEAINFAKYKKSFALIGMFLVYLLILNGIGFIISTSIFLFFSFVLFTNNNIKTYLFYIALSILFTVIVYYVFNNFLNLFLPSGIFG